jgi:DNA adenine methylase
MYQTTLFNKEDKVISRPKGQFLKWIGSKYRYAEEIVSYFPNYSGTYIEPFLGSGAVLATVTPENGIGSDIFPPLIEIWKNLKENPSQLSDWYAERWNTFEGKDKKTAYEAIKASYNRKPNGADFLFLTRSCYGGVVRFRKADGYMSTPVGIHYPISPDSFNARVIEWHNRVQSTNFYVGSFSEIMGSAKKGDFIYCDPPYVDSQGILYGAQGFSLEELMMTIEKCKSRGVHVALSIDGTKKSGNKICDIEVPDSLFEKEILINCGRSMLRRFQMNGQTLESEVVKDRLLLTYQP